MTADDWQRRLLHRLATASGDPAGTSGSEPAEAEAEAGVESGPEPGADAPWPPPDPAALRRPRARRRTPRRAVSPVPLVRRPARTAADSAPMPAGGGRLPPAAYHDPLTQTFLPLATGPVRLQYADAEESGGLFRRIGRFAAEAAYIAGTSGKLQRDVQNIETIRKPIGLGRVVGVVSAVPNSGTSVVTALLADVLATQRSETVLAVDADPPLGKLSHRLSAAGGAGARARVRLVRADPTYDGVQRALSGAVAGPPSLSVVDCPAGLFTPVVSAVATGAHATAVVVPTMPQAAAFSIDQLDRLPAEARRLLGDRAVVVITEVAANASDDVRWLRSMAAHRGLTATVLPYDPYLSSAWPLRSELLEPQTRRAVLELAARLVETATRHGG